MNLIGFSHIKGPGGLSVAVTQVSAAPPASPAQSSTCRASWYPDGEKGHEKGPLKVEGQGETDEV